MKVSLLKAVQALCVIGTAIGKRIHRAVSVRSASRRSCGPPVWSPCGQMASSAAGQPTCSASREHFAAAGRPHHEPHS
jgi:hypothetical protein